MKHEANRVLQEAHVQGEGFREWTRRKNGLRGEEGVKEEGKVGYEGYVVVWEFGNLRPFELWIGLTWGNM